MMRRLISLAGVALLAVSACGGTSPASPTVAPTPAATTPVAPTPGQATPTADPGTPAPTLAASPDAAETVTASVSDPAGSGALVATIPAAWITITARDIADEASFGAWQAAHPEVPQDSATSVAEDMSSAGVALFAFDAENAVDGFTPNLNTTWVDVPVGDPQAWLAEQAAAVTKGYGLAEPLEYQALTLPGAGGIDAFVGGYRYTLQDNALAGVQMIVPLPDGRGAVFTFTCRDEQTDHFGPIVEAVFTSVANPA